MGVLRIIKVLTVNLLKWLQQEEKELVIFFSHRPTWMLARHFLVQRILGLPKKPDPRQLQKSEQIKQEIVAKGLTISHDWFTRHIPAFVQVFEKQQLKPPMRILEIGSFEGLSTVGLSLLAPGSLIAAVDTWEGSPENLDPHSTYYSKFSAVEAAFDENTSSIKGLKKYRMDSLGFFNEVLRSRPPTKELFDFVYIDGSHHANDVLLDGLLAFEILSPGGILVFDDYLWSPQPKPEDVRHPADGINTFLRFLRKEDFQLLMVGYQVAILKKPKT